MSSKYKQIHGLHIATAIVFTTEHACVWTAHTRCHTQILLSVYLKFVPFADQHTRENVYLRQSLHKQQCIYRAHLLWYYSHAIETPTQNTMSSDEDDGLVRFGTPLDPIEEGEYLHSA